MRIVTDLGSAFGSRTIHLRKLAGIDSLVGSIACLVLYEHETDAVPPSHNALAWVKASAKH